MQILIAFSILSASREQRSLWLRVLSLNWLIFLLSTHVAMYRDVLSGYLARFSQRSFRPLFPLFIRYNTVQRFVPVTLAEWCQLHKDSCRAQKYRRGCWRGRLPALEGINWEKERGPSAREQKGPYVSEREARNRERRKGVRKREIRENPLYKGGDPMNKKTGRKSTNRNLVPPWHFLRTTVRGAKRWKKWKFEPTLRAVPPSLLNPRPSLFPTIDVSSFLFFISFARHLLDFLFFKI